jgi:hypothetical protein
MKKLMIVGILTALMGFSSAGNAAVSCSGRVSHAYKWNYMNTFSIKLVLANGSLTRWVNLPGKSEEAMALMALASDRQVEVFWSASDVTSCVDGWADNRALDGYLLVSSS